MMEETPFSFPFLSFSLVFLFNRRASPSGHPQKKGSSQFGHGRNATFFFSFSFLPPPLVRSLSDGPGVWRERGAPATRRGCPASFSCSFLFFRSRPGLGSDPTPAHTMKRTSRRVPFFSFPPLLSPFPSLSPFPRRQPGTRIHR